MRRTIRIATIAIVAIAATAVINAQQTRQNPFKPPVASINYAIDRQYDLIHLEVDTNVNYGDRKLTGTAINTLAPLRDGLKELMFMAGEGMEIQAITVNGRKANFRRDGKHTFVTVSNPPKGKKMDVKFTYSVDDAQGRGFGQGGGGWHWIQPSERQPNPLRVGFWTQGESEYNSQWVPTWDYPNDFATTRTTTTVQADWIVIGNGLLTSKTFDKQNGTATFVWEMTQPHATYLLSLVGGPFDIKKDMWKDVELWYVVPKGFGDYIEDTFGNTKDMLTFFSDRLGVKYPWPKYAQNSMYDFGGGMENVSATTLGSGAITESRFGYRLGDSINSHELGHQWFGDLVTTMYWGDIWLNESFATYMQSIYFEHDRGADAYAWVVEGNTNTYLNEARRYKRPLSTHMYGSQDSLFDSHAYPKGATVLHTLRRFLGDDNFYAGIKLYLDRWQYTPVESAQLRRAMTDATGINVEKFFAQWIDSPGHPVLDYTWTHSNGKLQLTVKQLQDTGDGTPIYDIETKIGFVTQGKDGFQYAPVHLTQTEETFEIPMGSKPLCVVLDPHQDFLRQIPELHWAKSELQHILKWSPNAPTRSKAMDLMLEDPTDADIKLITAALAADRNGPIAAYPNTRVLSRIDREDLRQFWHDEVTQASYPRRARAVVALGRLEENAETTRLLRAQINDKAPIAVVTGAIRVLGNWDLEANRDVLEKALTIKDMGDRIKRAAERALDN